MAMRASPDFSTQDHYSDWPQAMSLSSSTFEASHPRSKGHSTHSARSSRHHQRHHAQHGAHLQSHHAHTHAQQHLTPFDQRHGHAQHHNIHAQQLHDAHARGHAQQLHDAHAHAHALQHHDAHAHGHAQQHSDAHAPHGHPYEVHEQNLPPTEDEDPELQQRIVLIDEIVHKLKQLEPRIPLLSFMTIGHDAEENDLFFNSLFSLPRRKNSERVLRRDVLDRNFRREWFEIRSPVLPERTINILWGDSPGATSSSEASGSAKMRDLHRLNRESNKASMDAFLSQKNVDACLCIINLLKRNTSKDHTSVFKVPYKFFAKDFVKCGLTVVTNTDIMQRKRLQCKAPGCRCEEFREREVRGLGQASAPILDREQKVCSHCSHKKDRHVRENNKQLHTRKEDALTNVQRRMSEVFHGKGSVVEKGDEKGMKKVLKNIFDISLDVRTKSVPFLESKFEEFFEDGLSKWFVDLWYKVFMRLDDDSLYAFYMATDLQTELNLASLEKVLKRVTEAVERRYPPTKHEQTMRQGPCRSTRN